MSTLLSRHSNEVAFVCIVSQQSNYYSTQALILFRFGSKRLNQSFLDAWFIVLQRHKMSIIFIRKENGRVENIYYIANCIVLYSHHTYYYVPLSFWKVAKKKEKRKEKIISFFLCAQESQLSINQQYFSYVSFQTKISLSIFATDFYCSSQCKREAADWHLITTRSYHFPSRIFIQNFSYFPLLYMHSSLLVQSILNDTLLLYHNDLCINVCLTTNFFLPIW